MKEVLLSDGLAASARSAGNIRHESAGIFDLDFVAKELSAMRRALKLDAKPTPVEDLEEEEWTEMILALIGDLGPVFETESLENWGSASTDRERRAVAGQVRRALASVSYAKRCVDAEGFATGALLPTSFARRVALLIGQGELPLAWVRRLDVLKF